MKTTLVLRNRSGVTLTRTGEELLRYAHDVLHTLERAEQAILGIETEAAGRFVVGCHESLGAYFLPDLMLHLLEAAPRIELSLWNGTSAAVHDAVIARQVDFGLVVNAREHPELVIVELFRDAVDVFVAAHLLEKNSPRDLFRNRPLVFAGRVEQCRSLIDQLGAAGLVPARLLSCGDLELTKSLALTGVGVALLPRRVAAYGQRGKLVRLDPDLPFFPDQISLIYRADMHRTKAAMRLKEELVAHGKRLTAENPV
ncbi:MAG: LysR family transcriptional regulator substrate-binding protein [Polyangiaceae bacterium]|nr:LysR family transcriptional regulator substrate-binding protein [Polyangiaceae bacterium]